MEILDDLRFKGFDYSKVLIIQRFIPNIIPWKLL